MNSCRSGTDGWHGPCCLIALVEDVLLGDPMRQLHFFEVFIITLLAIACAGCNDDRKITSDEETQTRSDTVDHTTPPADGACSAEIPNGTCPENLTCVGGECVAVALPSKCSTENPCAAGFVCQNGECISSPPEPKFCSPKYLDGPCEVAEEVCENGICVTKKPIINFSPIDFRKKWTDYSFLSKAKNISQTIEVAAISIDKNEAEMAIIKKIWPHGKIHYTDYIRNHILYNADSKADGGYVLYNVQISLMNLLILATDLRDIDLINDLCDIASLAYSYLATIDGEYPFRNTPPTILPEDKLDTLSWIDFKKTTANPKQPWENVIVTGQWLYFVSSLVNGIATIPPSKRTDQMRLLLKQYTPYLDKTYARLLFAEDDDTKGNSLFGAKDTFSSSFIGWASCLSDKDGNMIDPTHSQHHFRVILSKLIDTYNDVEKHVDPGYCNVVYDSDVQILAGLVEYLAAYKKDPAHVTFDTANEINYHNHITNIIDLIIKQHFNNPITGPKSSLVPGFQIKPGAYTDHPSYIYAGFEYDKHPPSKKDEKKVKGLGDDVSHFTRFAWLLRTLSLNRNITKSAFPDKEDTVGLANQITYKVFKGDLDKPQFTTYMDGSNGWFRADPYEGSKATGVGPNGGTVSVITGGYLLYTPLSTELKSIADRLWKIFKMTSTDPELKDYVDSYYYEWIDPTIKDPKEPGYQRACTYKIGAGKSEDTWDPCERLNSSVGLDPNASGDYTLGLIQFLPAYINNRKF